MGLVYTIAGLQTQLDAVAAAIDASNYSGARDALAKAHVVLVGIPLEAKAGEAVVKMRDDLDKLAATITAAQDAASATDRRRLIRTGVSHGGGRRG